MIIGIEGVSCTGKTTLALALAARLGNTSVVSCYYQAAPDPSALSARPVRDETDQLALLAVHLDIEELRQRRAQTAADGGSHVILDRTVDTLLAHVRAVGLMQGLDANATARALVCRQVDRGLAVLPAVTLLLQADHQVVAARARARVGMPSLYFDADFTRGFHTHFADPLTPTCLPVNAAPAAGQVLDQAIRLLTPYLEGAR
ncbi:MULTISPECIES: AAA family ATPase [Frankia]|uniref:AAA family ATPase n=1 Tax=Frankia TaxID=1854 RepID=UPI002118618F|nr:MULTISPECIES: AAA family ATPase [Frankia]